MSTGADAGTRRYQHRFITWVTISQRARRSMPPAVVTAHRPASRRITMPDKRTIEKARKDKREGKSATTQAGEFVREQIRKIRRGLHGARSSRQAIAIGLSEARRAGVDLPPPGKGKARKRTRKSARYAY